jgi:hypothetical protein
VLEASLGDHGRALGRLLRAGDHALAGEGEGLGKSSHGDGVPWNDGTDKKWLFSVHGYANWKKEFHFFFPLLFL